MLPVASLTFDRQKQLVTKKQRLVYLKLSPHMSAFRIPSRLEGISDNAQW